jgi:anthranilate phosphoribosyltransferase
MLKQSIASLVSGKDMTCEAMQQAIGLIIDGGVNDAQIAAFLVALRIKGETAGEIEGAVRGITERMKIFPTAIDDAPIDTCGTGGDASNSFNISTAAGLLAAACGAKVVKHGNRAISSSCGSADVLTALGIDIEMGPETACQSLRETNFCFCFAPAYHPAIRNVAPIRKEIGLRTIFNIVGPLVNPSALAGQVIGVYDRLLLKKLADVMMGLGRKRAMLVYGDGGMDEITLTGKSFTISLHDGRQTYREIDPLSFELDYCSPEDLIGGTPEKNAEIIRKIFAGEAGGRRNTVVANASAALFVQGMATDLADGARLAEAAIDSGTAQRTLKAIVELSRK